MTTLFGGIFGYEQRKAVKKQRQKNINESVTTEPVIDKLTFTIEIEGVTAHHNGRSARLRSHSPH